ncbi:MAG: hypothetical protein JNL41_14955 [Phenylobacterium sp.]|uniref:helix-turn-helix transcriptional regulator n=1 Tax=Phenylobacterium sp. TaxID=1871053 RepID=UPI001A555985|nr:LuxR C-terminal-related transcriptional regulator [Phenylobacterium sp.]MBL8555571.1 hypothetical protein [Phenylobacterium sp.]
MNFSRRINQVALDIHEAAPLRPFATFREGCLHRLRELIPFDSAIWGSGVQEPMLIFGIAAVDFSAERLVEYGVRWQAHDLLRAAVAQRPGEALRNEDIQTLGEHYQSEIYQAFCGPGGMEHALGVTAIDPVTQVGELVYLFRADRRAVFRDDERDALELLMPHLAAAWRHRLLWHVARGGDGSGRAPPPLPDGHAVVDGLGQVHASDPAFGLRMRTLFDGWIGPLLPPPLRALVAGTGDRTQVKGQRFRLHRGGDRHVLSFADLATEPPLSPAELRVATAFARGLTAAEAAAELRISRATARNQLAAVYAKLDVHSKVELARRLEDAGG